LPKLKTHRGAAKRLTKTGRGKIKRAHAYKSHLLTHKSRTRKRRLRKSAIAEGPNFKQAASLIPYK